MTNEKPLYLYSTIITNLLTNCIISALSRIPIFLIWIILELVATGKYNSYFTLAGLENKTILQNNYYCSCLHEILGSQPALFFTSNCNNVNVIFSDGTSQTMFIHLW